MFIFGETRILQIIQEIENIVFINVKTSEFVFGGIVERAGADTLKHRGASNKVFLNFSMRSICSRKTDMELLVLSDLMNC